MLKIFQSAAKKWLIAGSVPGCEGLAIGSLRSRRILGVSGATGD
jgi:hypothetical protein